MFLNAEEGSSEGRGVLPNFIGEVFGTLADEKMLYKSIN